MAHNLLVDMKDVQFVLFEMLKVGDLARYEKFSGHDREIFQDTLNLAQRIAWDKMYPVDSQGDEEGVHYHPGTMSVTVPECFHEPYRAMTGAGFISISDAPELGGMGMPQCVSVACKEYFCSASAALSFFALLTGSAAGLIRRFGSDGQKGLYLDKMLKGKWGGTMCLTEPGAGSDVGNMRTRALPMPDGTYHIEGQKIFISAGEHDLTENIIHMVLARVEGAPPGTRGLSLFIVPKYLVGPDGSPAGRNGVFCRGVEKKMGFHGSPTCALSFGEDAPCTGFLLGREGSGMKLMFRMMNEERLFCGLQGLASSSYAYLHAVDYARQRVQGSPAAEMLNPAAERVAIIEHPDVRRMLFWMKSHVEGMRMLTYYLALCLDLEETGAGEKSSDAAAMADLLIPICKAGNTDMVWLITAEAIQVFGGYGFCRDYPLEHVARACKVLSIVEGTNGIQSICPRHADSAGHVHALPRLDACLELEHYGTENESPGENCGRFRGCSRRGLLPEQDPVIEVLSGYGVPPILWQGPGNPERRRGVDPGRLRGLPGRTGMTGGEGRDERKICGLPSYYHGHSTTIGGWDGRQEEHLRQDEGQGTLPAQGADPRCCREGFCKQTVQQGQHEGDRRGSGHFARLTLYLLPGSGNAVHGSGIERKRRPRADVHQAHPRAGRIDRRGGQCLCRVYHGPL